MMAKESFKARIEKEVLSGEKVRVMAGPFKGLKGSVIIHRSQSRILICIESIMQAVSVEINPHYIEKIKN